MEFAPLRSKRGEHLDHREKDLHRQAHGKQCRRDGEADPTQLVTELRHDRVGVPAAGDPQQHRADQPEREHEQARPEQCRPAMHDRVTMGNLPPGLCRSHADDHCQDQIGPRPPGQALGVLGRRNGRSDGDLGDRGAGERGGRQDQIAEEGRRLLEIERIEVRAKRLGVASLGNADRHAKTDQGPEGGELPPSELASPPDDHQDDHACHQSPGDPGPPGPAGERTTTQRPGADHHQGEQQSQAA